MAYSDGFHVHKIQKTHKKKNCVLLALKGLERGTTASGYSMIDLMTEYLDSERV